MITATSIRYDDWPSQPLASIDDSPYPTIQASKLIQIRRNVGTSNRFTLNAPIGNPMSIGMNRIQVSWVLVGLYNPRIR